MMGKTLYFDMFAGCSGDMVLGGLLDAGLDFEELTTQLSALPITGYRITKEQVYRSALSATHASVIIENSTPQSDRTYTDIAHLINSSRLPDGVKAMALKIFKCLGEAESHVHGVPLEKVHFHEVGAVDSIIDIVGSAIGFHLMDIDQFYASSFPLGPGYIQTRHGMLPLPAPATLEIIANTRAPVINAPLSAMQSLELVTPTGAAIVCTLAKFEMPSMTIESTGYGAGSRDSFEYPNCLRLWIGTPHEQSSTDDIVLLETNIDDMNPQAYDYILEKLFHQGALDVWLTPIQMKKNRPAIMLSVLCPDSLEKSLVEVILRETTTLGIRARPVSRYIAERDIVEIKSRYGRVRIKVKKLKGEILGISPEYEDCRRIAERSGIPLMDIYRNIEAEGWKLIGHKQTSSSGYIRNRFDIKSDRP